MPSRIGLHVSPQVFNQFRIIWADHGDDISRQYAGTGALKSGFTRTGTLFPTAACLAYLVCRKATSVGRAQHCGSIFRLQHGEAMPAPDLQASGHTAGCWMTASSRRCGTTSTTSPTAPSRTPSTLRPATTPSRRARPLDRTVSRLHRSPGRNSVQAWLRLCPGG